MSDKIDDCFKKNVPNYTYRKGYKSDIKYCIDWHELIREVYSDLPSNLIIFNRWSNDGFRIVHM